MGKKGGGEWTVRGVLAVALSSSRERQRVRLGWALGIFLGGKCIKFWHVKMRVVVPLSDKDVGCQIRESGASLERVS